VALIIQLATNHENFIVREKIGNNHPSLRTNKNLHYLCNFMFIQAKGILRGDELY